MTRGLFGIVLAAAVACAQGTPPRKSASEYAAHAPAGDVVLGAEYLVHTFYSGRDSFFVRDYLVVEVGVFGARADVRDFMVSSGHFTLQMNGKKQVMFPQAAGFVAASLRYDDWERRPAMTVGAGAGNGGVIIGGQTPTERFPGDPTVNRRRAPNPPTAPSGNVGGVDPEQRREAHEAVREVPLPEGEVRLPVSGYLFFAFKGKTKQIKTLDLVYTRGDTVTRLPLVSSAVPSSR